MRYVPGARGWLIALALALFVAVASVAFLHSRPIALSANRVVELRIQPVPEGPMPAMFQRSPSPGALAISTVLQSVPTPLPHPAWQFGCSTRGDLLVTLDDGRVITYGPCRRPASINRLWAAMMTAATHGACRPRCGP